MMPNINMTADEIVATLVRSNLPTIIVEGKNDMSIYRWIENRIGYSGNVLPCGGRSQLLQIFDRRNEFHHLHIAFIADKDMWLFTVIPEEYLEIIWTEGYSIENDLYAGANLESLMDPDEKVDFNLVLDCIIEWFAFEVEQYRNGQNAETNKHPNEIVPLGECSISVRFITDRGFCSPAQETILEIRENYQLKVRGKILFDLLARYLSASNRQIKHSNKALYEISFKNTPDHIHMNRLTQAILSALG
jgi:hypothetical protein